MRKFAILALLPLALSCTNKKDVEARINNYIKDTTLQHFNDPSSYQLVSMDIDTVSDKKRYAFDLKYWAEVIATDKHRLDSVKKANDNIMAAIIDTEVVDNQKRLDSLKANPAKDRTWYYVNVKCRGKNKFGALVLNNMKFRYYPDTDRVIEEERED